MDPISNSSASPVYDALPLYACDHPGQSVSGWRLALSGSAIGLALGSFGAMPAFAADAPTNTTGSVVTPAVSVDANANADSYKVPDSQLLKLPTKLLDTPQTVNTVSPEQMKEQNVTSLRDALRDVPGISLGAGESGAQGDNLTIRGFSGRNDIFLDGMRDFGSYTRDSFNTESVEVLKGPSSMLFGRGSTGGAVEQDSKVPELRNFTTGTATVGTDLTKRLTIDTNHVLSQEHGTAIRLNVMGDNAGFTGRDKAENSRLGVAPSITTGLGTPTRVTFSYLHQQEYDVPDYGLPWNFSAPAGAGTAIAQPANVSMDNYYGLQGNYLRTDVDILTGKIEHDFNDQWTLRDQVRWGRYSRSYDITEPQIVSGAGAPGSAIAAAIVAPGTALNSVLVGRNQISGNSVESFLQNQLDTTGHFKTGSFKHTMVAGIELTRETSNPNRNSTIGPISVTSLTNPNEDPANNAIVYPSSTVRFTALSQAAYIADTMEITPQWQLMGGVRYDRFDAKYDSVTFNNPVTGTGAALLGLKHVDNRPSWRVGLVYKPAPNGTVYADWGTSFNPSAESLSLSASTSSLAPETDEAYELGTKWELMKGQLTVDAALFHIAQNNIRETDPLNSNNMILAGNAVSKGAELSVTGHITHAWEATAGYTYDFGKIVSSPQTDVGNRLANAPMHTFTFWSSYKFQNKLKIGGGVDVVASRFAASTFRSVGGVNFKTEAPGYHTFSAMASYPLNDKISLQVNAINLTDEQYYDLLHPSHVVPGEGRTFLFSTSFKL